MDVDNDHHVCVVGNIPFHKVGVLKSVVEAIDDIPIRMLSYGGSKFNISLLIESKYKAEALTRLNEHIFHRRTWTWIMITPIRAMRGRQYSFSQSRGA